MTERTRGRPRKYPVDEVRERLFEVARSALRERGVTSGLAAVTLDGAIQDAGVPRGSAYRMWHHDDLSPQDAFRREVTLDLLRTLPTSTGLPTTEQAYDDVMGQLGARADKNDPESMRAVLIELMRVLCSHNFELLDGNHDWQVYCALRSAAMTRYGSDPEVDAAIRYGEERVIDNYAQLYERIATYFEHTIRPGLTFNEFSAAAYAMNEGLANRSATNFRRREIRLPSGPDGREQPWTLMSVGFHALVDYFFVPISHASDA